MGVLMLTKKSPSRVAAKNVDRGLRRKLWTFSVMKPQAKVRSKPSFDFQRLEKSVSHRST